MGGYSHFEITFNLSTKQKTILASVRNDRCYFYAHLKKAIVYDKAEEFEESEETEEQGMSM